MKTDLERPEKMPGGKTPGNRKDLPTATRTPGLTYVLISGFILAFLFTLAPTSSHAASVQDPEAQTRNLLIEKLTQVHQNLAPTDPASTGITLRLADLYSERARQLAMANVDTSQSETVANADRKKALALYLSMVDKASPEARGKINTQIGHLYELLGDEAQAITTYRKILKENQARSAQAEAHLSLGEILFKKREFAQAEAEYQAVLAIPEATSRGLAAYRLAWCQFNQGRVDVAIQGLKTILSTPALLSRGATVAGAAPVIDPQFQEEVSGDLVTFDARRAVTSADVQDIYRLSPENAKLPNLAALATELERVGQTQAAIDVWRFHQDHQAKPQARLEGQVHLSQLLNQLGDRPGAVKEYQQALVLWGNMGGCHADDCKEIHSRLRKFVLDWNRVEKKTPSAELLATYQAYLAVFPEETDMRLWAAQVASSIKNYDVALELYKTSIEALSSKLRTKASASETAETRATLEAATLSAIEVAELSKKPASLDTAYSLYLTYSPDKKRQTEVRYQQARLIYERGDYPKAAVALKDVALSKEPGPTEIKIQAADLALDSLVLAKKEANKETTKGNAKDTANAASKGDANAQADAQLEKWADEFAVAFPAKKDDYAQIARTSILNQVVINAKPVEAGAAGDVSLNKAWDILARFPVAEATPTERATYFKNRLVLAEKLHKFPEARDAANAELTEPAVSAADKEYAMTRKAWLAEMMLDFDSALSATEKIPLASFAQPDQKYLKLALFSELAKKDAKPFYERYIQETNDAANRKAVAARLVRESAQPAKEFEKQKALLKSDTPLYARLALEIAVQNNNFDMMKKLLKEPGVEETPAGQAMARALILRDLDQMKEKFANSKLVSTTQKKLAASLKARMKLIQAQEALAQTAIRSKDWTAQLLTLDDLAKESNRFYTEILQLPVPQGLSEEEEQQYLQLLGQQASPHQVRAQELAKKVDEFWQTAQNGGLATLKKGLDAETGAMHTFLAKQLARLQAIAPDADKAQIASLLQDQPRAVAATSEPSRESLEQATTAVRENPLNRESVANLLSLEKAAGHGPMVAYLESRLATTGGAQSATPAVVPAPETERVKK